MRLQIARQISPTFTQAQLEKTKPTPFLLAQFAGVSTQTKWRTIVVSWIKNPGNLNKHLEIAGEIMMAYSAWDPALGFYRCTGLQIVAPIWWAMIQQEGDPMGYLRASLSQMLYEEVTTLGAVHKASSEAFRQGLNVGFEGLKQLPWVEWDGLRSIQLALLSLRSVRSGDVLKMEESLRRLHYKFTGDAKLAQAMEEAESVIRKAAEMNVVPAWADVGQPTYTAISVTCGYFYAKAATPFSDGGLAKGWDMQDCTATLDLLFDQLKNKINEATHYDENSEKVLKKKGTQLEAMRAVIKGTKDVRSELYRGLPDHQQKEIQTCMVKERIDLKWGSNKTGKNVHALSMQLSNGQVLSLPSGEQGKRGAPRDTTKRNCETGGVGIATHP